NAQQAIFAPAISSTAGLIMRKVFPGRAVWGIVLAHRAPLPLGEVGSPALPVGGARVCLFQSFCFRGHGATLQAPAGRFVGWQFSVSRRTTFARDAGSTALNEYDCTHRRPS